ncbi:MAG: glutamate--tRNA ligase [Candidatus Altimarinota bacterium]
MSTSSNSSKSPVRTRFAPSPTGYLHIGGLRTALYSYLFAKNLGGQSILRIEDTDQTRFVPGATENLIHSLNSMGLEFDEGPIAEPGAVAPEGSHDLSHLKQIGDKGPYIQSQRTAIYQEHAAKLVEKGNAYYCFCTSVELDEMRAQQTAAKLAPMYDRRCLKLTPEQVKTNLDAKKPFVIRLKMPRDQKIEFVDLIRGKVSFMGNQVDDQVLIKSDGLPTYHLANVVDDHSMEITHVIRGEEWLASTPKHLVMYQAFGWEAPAYAHLPLILNADRSKLSKRQNDVSVESYLAKDYLKEAIINFIALLGWHPGKGIEQEIFSMEDLIKQFSIEGVNKSGAVFSLEKLDWFNLIWKKKLLFAELESIAKKIDPAVKIEHLKHEEKTFQFSTPELLEKFNTERAALLFQKTENYLNHYKELPRAQLDRALLVNEEKILKDRHEIHSHLQYFFDPQGLNQQLLINPKMGVETSEQAIQSITFAREIIAKLPENASLETIKNTFLETIKSAGQKNGQILWPLRAALTHEQFSVGAFETIWVLGQAESIKRLDEILQK